MDLSDTVLSNALALEKFGIGQRVLRTEDPVLVRGMGQYTDDISLPDQLYAVFVRSSHAHGTIRGINTEAARAMPGVLAVYTGDDLQAAGYGSLACKSPLKSRDGTPIIKPNRPALPTDKVRFVGDPVAVVIAKTLYQAKDAAEAVQVDIDPLPAVTTASEAAKPDAPTVYDVAPGNVVLDFHFGDAAKVAEAFANAHHVTRAHLINSRVVIAPIEPRCGIGEYDKKNGKFTLHVPTQGVVGNRDNMAADMLKVTPDKLRILTGNVGGSFGMKSTHFPEYACLLHAAKELGHPVKWTDERSTSFLSDHHGRDAEMTIELALDKEGHFLAVRVTGYGNSGAYLGVVGPLPSTVNLTKNVIGMYRTPLLEVSTKAMMTTSTIVSAYRGAGRPEGNYYMERAIDLAAQEMGIDRVTLRKRNLVRANQMPYMAASEMLYDSGDFPGLFTQALEASDYKGFAKRRRASKAAGKLRGIGIGCYVEVTAPANRELGGVHFEPDGSVTILSGTLDYGQGHSAPLAQVLVSKLGLPFEKIRLFQSDSDRLIAGGGTGGSRTAMNAGGALVEASEKIIQTGKQAAAHFLEAAAADIEFRAGRFTIAGTDRSIGIMELASRLREAKNLPPGVPQTLDIDHVTPGYASAFPNGCHVAEVEIDPETGVTKVVKYTAVNDFGTILNPPIVEGQLHGGVIQAIGQTLMERVAYDESGQLLTGSFMDYAMPRAEDAPVIEIASHPVPATTNPLGAKGCGEAGCAGGLTSIMNAIGDALAPLGIRHIDMPVTPEKMWRAIRDAQATEAPPTTH